MASLVLDLMGEIRLKHHSGRPDQGGHRQSQFNSRVNNLWRVAQGSNAAVIKKIYNGGTHTPKQLGNQLNYLFSKANAVFGNHVSHDPRGRALTPEQRKEIVGEWSDGWTRTPKNGHTTHLLLSFPADVQPKRALAVAEAWAAEMFQSGEHQQDEWAYIAALHTDRAHPHVHIVVNNRGIENGEWFYMAKGHAFNLDMMKQRMVELAAEQGMYLDHSSRVDRGILTYGPSRAELERALREGRAVAEKPLMSIALQRAMAQIGANVRSLRVMASLVAEPSGKALAEKFIRAAETLESGGILTPVKEKVMEAQAIQNRGQVIEFYEKWMESSERQIDQMGEPDRTELRKELYQVAGEVAAGLGDKRAAQLINLPARETVYNTRLSDTSITKDHETRQLSPDAAQEMQSRVANAAKAIGLDPVEMRGRMAQGADNAWQEREWIKRDIVTVAAANKLDLDREKDRGRTAELLDGFYKMAETTLATALERRATNDRVTRTLSAMAESNARTGQVLFRSEDDAARFTADLKERYGEDVLKRIVSGDDRALATDFADSQQRRAIARAIVTAAEATPGIGLSLREAEVAKENLRDANREQDRDASRERQRGRDRDDDLEF